MSLEPISLTDQHFSPSTIERNMTMTFANNAKTNLSQLFYFAGNRRLNDLTKHLAQFVGTEFQIKPHPYAIILPYSTVLAQRWLMLSLSEQTFAKLESRSQKLPPQLLSCRGIQKIDFNSFIPRACIHVWTNASQLYIIFLSHTREGSNVSQQSLALKKNLQSNKMIELQVNYMDLL